MKHFITQISSDSVVFTSRENGITVSESAYEFKDRNEHRYREQLNEFLNTSGIRDRDHDEHTISWSGFQTSLVPANVFAESNVRDIFKLCFGSEIPPGDVDYNRLPELSMVNVFQLPVWVKSFFVMSYPRSIIQHEGTMLLRSFTHNTPVKLKILIVPYKRHFTLLMADAGKLQFYSQFDYTNMDDILYNLLFVLQQKDLIEKSGELIWSSGVGCEVAFEELKAKASAISNLKPLALREDTDFILNSHKLCV